MHQAAPKKFILQLVLRIRLVIFLDMKLKLIYVMVF